jgi:putative FmdB family regulatory protein
MPIYTFKCSKCQSAFDKLLGYEASIEFLKKPCPFCGERALTRPIAAPAVHMRYSQMHPRHLRGQRGKVQKRNTELL